MNNRKVAAFVFSALLIASYCHAWHVNTHLQMTKDAISLMPSDLQAIFTEHQKYVEAGIREPDEVLKDWQNHYYIPSNPPEGGCIDRIEKLAGVIQTKFKAGSTLDISRQLTYIAHYIADLWTPEYLIKQNTAPDQLFTQDNEILVFFGGYKAPIDNFREYFTHRSEWRWRIENSKQVSTLLYSAAVEDIARTWLTLWQQSGHEVAPVKAAAILHKRGVLTVNFERLLLEEGSHWDMWNVGGDTMDRTAAHYDEMSRLSESVVPSDAALAARAQIRNQNAKLSELNPNAPFKMIETSLRPIGNKSYLVVRMRNQGQQEISSLSLMSPGIKGPVAQVQNFKPGQVVLIEAWMPGDAKKDALQVVFATAQ